MWAVLRRQAVAALAVAMTACGGLDEFEEVIVEEASIARTDGNGINGPFSPSFGAGFSDIDLSQARTFENEGISPDDVDAIYVKSVTLEVDTGTDDSRLDQLHFYIEGMEMNVTATGQSEAMIAELPTPVAMTRVANLDVPPMLNLKPYATADSMTVTANVRLKEPRGVNFVLRTTITLLIDVNILGQ